MKTFVLTGVLSLLMCCPAWSGPGPFGIEMGMPVEALTMNTTFGPNDPGSYYIDVPVPNSEFEVYVASATPRVGVCGITALGKSYHRDQDGHQVRDAYSRLKTALIKKYGPPLKDKDSLVDGAKPHNEDEFALALNNHQRRLNVAWKFENEAPADISYIFLSATASNGSETSVNLSYKFTNEDECRSVPEAAVPARIGDPTGL